MQACSVSLVGAPEATCPPQRILVVDDDPTIRQINLALLKRSGYEVDEAEDGAAAWAALNTDCYDLLITDNNMPHVTGIDLLKKLRAARMEMPVIMATGNPPVEEFRRHPWLEPDATLVKPYAVKVFLQTVKAVLRAADPTRDSPVRAASFAPAPVDSTVTLNPSISWNRTPSCNGAKPRRESGRRCPRPNRPPPKDRRDR